MDSLEAMAKAAGKNNVPMLLVNPMLFDRPSSNNNMQVR